MKLYDIYAHTRIRTKGKDQKKTEEYHDGPYQCPEEAKDVMEDLNENNKITKTTDTTQEHTSYQIKKRDASDEERDQVLEETWEIQQQEIEDRKEEAAEIVKPKKRKSFKDDDEKRTHLTIFPQEKENKSCLEAQTQY